MTLDTANKRDQAMQSFAKNGIREKTVDWQTAQAVRKGHVLNSKCCQKRAKLRFPNLLKERKQYSMGLFGCCSKVVVEFYCKEDIHLLTVNFEIVLVCQTIINIVAYHSHSFKELTT